MFKFLQLTRTEIYKVFYSKRFFLVLFALTISLIFITVRQNHIANSFIAHAELEKSQKIQKIESMKKPEASDEEIKAQENELTQFSNELDKIKDHPYSALQASYTVLFSNYASFYILPIAMILMASGSLAMELANGSAKMWLLRPINRVQMILAKWIASVVGITTLLIITTSFGFLLGGAFFGYDKLHYGSQYILGVPDMGITVLEYICQNGLYIILAMSLIASISIFFSTLASSPFVVIVGTMICSLIGVSTGSYFLRNPISAYLPFSHFSFGNHFILNTAFTVEQSVIAMIAYNIIFLTLAAIIFKKKDMYV